MSKYISGIHKCPKCNSEERPVIKSEPDGEGWSYHVACTSCSNTSRHKKGVTIALAVNKWNRYCELEDDPDARF